MAEQRYGPHVTLLSTGYWHVRWSSECWAQIPRNGELRREHVFHPDWNWDKVQEWWNRNESRLENLAREEGE